MRHFRKVYASSAVALAAGVLAGTAAPATASTTAAMTRPTTAVVAAPNTVVLTPGYLPAGFVLSGVEDMTTTNDAGQAVNVHTVRYTKDSVVNGVRSRDVLYFEVDTGGSGELPDASQGASAQSIGGFTGVFLDTAGLREFDFDPGPYINPTVYAAIAAIGTIGHLPDDQLQMVIGATSITEGVASIDGLNAIDTDPDGGSSGCSSTCPSSTNMKGTGAYTDDWSTDGANRTIQSGSQGNDVGVWQGVLYADAADDGGNYPYFSSCWVDGMFGQQTTLYTENWQRSNLPYDSNYVIDGIVGPHTWGVADNRLVAKNGVIFYKGSIHTLTLKRKSTAPYDYTWSWAGSTYKYTGYSGIDMKRLCTV